MRVVTDIPKSVVVGGIITAILFAIFALVILFGPPLPAPSSTSSPSSIPPERLACTGVSITVSNYYEGKLLDHEWREQATVIYGLARQGGDQRLIWATKGLVEVVSRYPLLRGDLNRSVVETVDACERWWR